MNSVDTMFTSPEDIEGLITGVVEKAKHPVRGKSINPYPSKPDDYDELLQEISR